MPVLVRAHVAVLCLLQMPENCVPQVMTVVLERASSVNIARQEVMVYLKALAPQEILSNHHPKNIQLFVVKRLSKMVA